MPHQKIAINEGWHFKQTTTLANSTASSYLPCAQFPTVAHVDLLHHGLIPDPYVDTNELDTLWINDADFTYQTKVIPSVSFPKGTSRAHLVFDGLDTIVPVYLNDNLILESEDMHISHRVDVTHLLKKENVLELRFKNSPEHAKKEMKRIGYRGDATNVHFGGPERLFVRKAQYHWGWDWGPAVNTSGPWKEIWLQTFEERIDELIVRQDVAADLAGAKISAKGKTEGLKEGSKVLLQIANPEGQKVLEQEVSIDSKGAFSATLAHDKDLQLWYPFTYGSQPLYTITASLPSEHSISQKLGLRRLRLLQHPLNKEPGTSFLFEIINTPIFAGGFC